MEISPTDLAYAAGVIDSDGYIGIHRSTYAMRVKGDATQAVYMPRVTVKQVTPQAVDFLHAAFGGHRLVGKPTAARGRPLLAWSVHSAMAVRVCEAVLPYLRIKRAQAQNAIDLGRINASGDRRRFIVPKVDPDEPMVTMAEAARRLGKSYAVVIQAVRQGNVPHVRSGPRKVLIPESYLPVWAERRRRPVRRPDITSQLEEHFQLARKLNRVGV